MIHLFALIIATAAIAYVQQEIWRKTREWTLVLPTLILYFWSLAGSWFMVIDMLTDNATKYIGVHYYVYLEKLFPMHLDGDYLETIILYALFILSFQITVLFFLRKKPVPVIPEKKPSYSPNIALFIAIVSAYLSYYFIQKQLQIAIESNQSLYQYLGHDSGNFYSMHLIFKTIALSVLFIGLAIHLSGKDAKFIVERNPHCAVAKYMSVLIVIVTFAMLLGHRHEIVYAGICAIVTYSLNTRKFKFKHLLILLIPLAISTAFTEATRGIPVINNFQTAMKSEDVVGEITTNILLKDTGSPLAFMRKYTTMLFSNEIFLGHMSLYGSIHSKLPLTYGSSFVYLSKAILPKFISPNRPPDIYQYYITIAQNPGIQGFTIHHAAGWYLNFGILGLIAGGIILGLLFGFIIHIFYHLENPKNEFYAVLKVIALPAFIASVPFIVRTGPEGYKALIIKGILITVFVIWLGCLKLPNLIAMKKNS